MDFRNSTDLDSERLERLFTYHAWPYRHDRLTVRVRYSRSADFSGTCYYTEARIFVNLGRRNRYPYLLSTNIARSQSSRTHWWRETYRLVLTDAYQLALFVFLHEFYHYLVKAAGRSPRRKEAMCDRFAARALVDAYRTAVVDWHGRSVPRETWDFQDLDGFVQAAPKLPAIKSPALRPAARPVPVAIRDVRTGTRRPRRPRADGL